MPNKAWIRETPADVMNRLAGEARLHRIRRQQEIAVETPEPTTLADTMMSVMEGMTPEEVVSLLRKVVSTLNQE